MTTPPAKLFCRRPTTAEGLGKCAAIRYLINYSLPAYATLTSNRVSSALTVLRISLDRAISFVPRHYFLIPNSPGACFHLLLVSPANKVIR